MANSFLNTQTLLGFIENTRLDREEKDFLLSKLPQLDEEGRRKLFYFLKEVFCLDREEKVALEKIRQNWKS